MQILDDSICLAADKFPLDQNCDYLEICKNELKFWYDDGTALAVYSGLKRILFDNQKMQIHFVISPKNLDNECEKVNFEMICVEFESKELFFNCFRYFKKVKI
ncbi:hypothetical protein [Campylobacter majalis]|uniref:hypothetical protein n=1 Tax=Campylobacter majalis TaxID=2790656 RepID=UPI003D69769C